MGEYKELRIVVKMRLADWLAIRKAFPGKKNESFADYMTRVREYMNS